MAELNIQIMNSIVNLFSDKRRVRNEGGKKREVELYRCDSAKLKATNFFHPFFSLVHRERWSKSRDGLRTDA